jgi:bifunctional non-homologous end joining protein LigD
MLPYETIFDAVGAGDIAGVRSFLGRGVALDAKNPHGFTALHCAASACNSLDPASALTLIELLLSAGAPVNAEASDGRTVLYLAAEFSKTLEPIKALIQAGADPNVRDRKGNHIVVNAMMPDVKQYLSALTGHPIPPPRLRRREVKLSTAEWREIKGHIDKVFGILEASGLVVLQDAGTTQDDGFADCSEVFQDGGGISAGLRGFCFYTRQDLIRAKRTSILLIAFWGAPDGNDESMIRVGQEVVTAFRNNGFTVDWSGAAVERPSVYLQGVGGNVG